MNTEVEGRVSNYNESERDVVSPVHWVHIWIVSRDEVNDKLSINKRSNNWLWKNRNWRSSRCDQNRRDARGKLNLSFDRSCVRKGIWIYRVDNRLDKLSFDSAVGYLDWQRSEERRVGKECVS